MPMYTDSYARRDSCPYPSARILASLLLSVGLAHASYAATDNFNDFDRLATELRSLDVTSEELPQVAGRALVNDASDLSAKLDSDHAESDVIAPILLLTPRLATILRSVFDTQLQVDDSDDVPGGHDGKPRAASPALVNAPSIALPEDSLASENNAEANDSQYVSRFQRQMYRTDI